MEILKLTETEFYQARGSDLGLCLACGKINDGFHEPDAENYQCDHCGELKSCGIEWALIGGDLEIVETDAESNLESRL